VASFITDDAVTSFGQEWIAYCLRRRIDEGGLQSGPLDDSVLKQDPHPALEIPPVVLLSILKQIFPQF